MTVTIRTKWDVMLDSGLMMKIRADVDRWEKPVPWMYLDSEGNVTVGAGLKLDTPADAQRLSFLHQGTGRPAGSAEIAAAWTVLAAGSGRQRAASLAKKFSAEHFKDESDLRIGQGVLDAYRDQHINADYYELRKIYRSFDNIPDNGKRALFDMIYNLGPGRDAMGHHRASGLRRYTAMNVAIDAGHWEVAARLSLRHGIAAERNRWTADLFRSCATRADVA